MNDPIKNQSAAERNRSEFPNAAAIVDEFKKHFGDGVKLLYAAENGKSIGNPSAGENGGTWVTPVIFIKPQKKERNGK